MRMNQHFWMALFCGSLMHCACPTTESGDDAGSSGNSSSSSSSSSSTGGSSSGQVGSSSLVTNSSAAASSGNPGSSSGVTSGGGSSAGVSSGANSSSEMGSSTSMQGPPPAYIFAHSATTLYRLDADTLEVVTLGDFIVLDTDGTTPITGNDARITDLAITSSGSLWACSSHALFEIEANTWRTVKRASLTETYVGLTWIPVGILDPTSEVLVGATSTGGSLYKINPQTGATTLLGTYGGSWLTSGDVVAIAGDAMNAPQMYATLKTATSTNDVLARIDPMTGQATIIGEAVGIGSTKIFGLGYWGGTLYGFDDAGNILAINRTTGVGTVAVNRPVVFWGAGVTTAAKIH